MDTASQRVTCLCLWTVKQCVSQGMVTPLGAVAAVLLELWPGSQPVTVQKLPVTK